MEEFIGLIGLFGIAILIVLGFNSFDKNQVRESCRVFSTESGYETKYVDYTFWNRDCLVESEDGTWVSAFNLYKVVE